MNSTLAGISQGGVKNGNQPDANRAARLSCALPSPPIQIGGCGFCTGLGANAMLSKDTYLPSKLGDSLVQSSTIADRYSSAIRPRSRKGTRRILNSSSIQPTP